MFVKKKVVVCKVVIRVQVVVIRHGHGVGAIVLGMGLQVIVRPVVVRGGEG